MDDGGFIIIIHSYNITLYTYTMAKGIWTPITNKPVKKIYILMVLKLNAQ